MKNIVIGIIVTAFLVGGGGFYGGMKYEESKSPRRFTQQGGNGFAALSPEERAQRRQQFGNGGGARGMRPAGQGGELTSGEIISKDDTSVTVKLRDGGSKIVFTASSTQIGKFVNGASSDLEKGKTIMITGSTNPDGSITARSIQLEKQQ